MPTSQALSAPHPAASVTMAQADSQNLLMPFRSQGVMRSIGNELVVTQHSTGTMQVDVDTGRAWVQGMQADLGTRATLDVAAADPANPRIDLVVLRLDTTGTPAVLSVAVKNGTPAGAPAAPGLTRAGGIYEIAVWQWVTGASVEAVTTAMLSGGDRRMWSTPLAPVTLIPVTTAATLTIPVSTSPVEPTMVVLPVTGAGTINTFSGIAPAGSVLVLNFQTVGASIAALTAGATLQRVFVAAAVGSLVTFVSDGVTWVEQSRANGDRATGNFVLAAPDAVTGAPTFRPLVDGDIPLTLTGRTFSGNSVFQAGLNAQAGLVLNNNQSIFSFDSGAVARRMLLMSASNVVQFGNLDVNANVELYRNGVRTAVLGAVGSVGTSGMSIGAGAAGPAYVCDVFDAWTTQQLMRVWNTGNAAGAGAMIVGAGNNSGGQIMNIYNATASTNVGNITHNGTITAYATTSDQRLKTKIHDARVDMEAVLGLRVRAWDWKHARGQAGFGFVAQELQAVAPEAVSVGPDGLLGIDYGKLTPYCIAAIQALAARVEQLEMRKR